MTGHVTTFSGLQERMFFEFQNLELKCYWAIKGVGSMQTGGSSEQRIESKSAGRVRAGIFVSVSEPGSD